MLKTSLVKIVITSMILIGASICLYGHEILDTDLIYQDFSLRFTETNPPGAPVRPIAEFEPASAVLIRYPLGIPTSLVAELADTAQVICIVSSTSTQNSATSAFNNAGVNMANVSFMIAPTDSYWTRDYGPWFIFDGLDEYAVVDFVYNRPRPNDNNIPQAFANLYDINYFGMNLQQTGGNYMTDGINTAAQSHIAYTENSGLGQSGVDAKMQNYLGISSYLVYQDPNGTYIDHIDCWGKFLAPDKVLIRSVPTSHSAYTALEAVANSFASTNCAWGYPYEVYRVYTPNNQPYTNSLILNKRVFVPIMNSSYDQAALNVYRSALPGYDVIGITGAYSTPWESTDALHCRTHEIPDSDMIWIGHSPLFGEAEGTYFDINATIKAHSGAPIPSDSVYVAYRVNQGSWQQTNLTHLTGTSYSTSLTGFASGDSIYYYIYAADETGKRSTHPLTAQYDPHVFQIEPDNIAPTIVHDDITHFVYENDPIIFQVEATDNTHVNQVFIRYREDGQDIQEYPMLEGTNNTWIFPYVPEYNPGQHSFEYQFRALDDSNPPNVGWYPSEDSWVQLELEIVDNADPNQVPAQNRLVTVYPNPFGASQGSQLTVVYETAKSGYADLEVYNLRGQLVYSEKHVSNHTGQNRLQWNGIDKSGNPATRGVYLLKLSIDGTVYKSKLLLGL